ncbi:MAG: amidohydrolase family protein [Treponema sp.]|nr:amidohydrolase family protein [Treponema sp.]
MKIDCHVHVTPPDIIANWEKYAQKEPYFSMISHSKVNKFAEAQDVVSVLKKDGFDKAVIFGFAFCDPGLCSYVNDYVIEMVKQFPQELTGFAVVPPGGRETENEIERCYNAGLKGVGELFPFGQKINLESKKDTQTIAGTCRELGLPLMLHANEPVGHYYPGKTDVPMKHFETFICDNPGLKIILSHFGGGIFLYESMSEVRQMFCNVYYDTAIAPYIYDSRIYAASKALGLCSKILFGSDFPILPPSRYLDALKKSGLPGNDKKKILGENAKRLLGI